jgi:hypothetical protein
MVHKPFRKSSAFRNDEAYRLAIDLLAVMQ